MRKFQGRKKEKGRRTFTEGEIGFRMRLPREGEIFALVEALHGGKRMTVKCADGKHRMARVSGRLRSIWIREGDYVLIEPWTIEGDKKADIVWRYRQVETDWLKRNNYLKAF